MHTVVDRVDLAMLQKAGKGFIFNARDDRKMLHAAWCEALEVMGTSKYQKVFFATYPEAKKWANKKFGEDGWEHCGRCGGGH